MTTAATPKPTAAPAATKSTATPAAPKTSTAGTKTTEPITTDALATDARGQFEALFKKFGENAETVRSGTNEMLASLQENLAGATAQAKDLQQELIAAAQDDLAEASNFTKDLMSAKSASEVLEIQHDYFANFLETQTERFQQYSARSTQTATETLEPISKTMSAYFEKSPFAAFFPFAQK